jgi:predicted Ser/Thr protein kinase
MTGDQLMTVAQAATLKRLAEAAYELDTFKPNLTRT